MNLSAFDASPLSLTREVEAFPIANIPLAEHQLRFRSNFEKMRHALTVHPRAWLDASDLSEFLASGKNTLLDSSQVPLAWPGHSADLSSIWVASSSFLIRYPWDFLRANEQYIAALKEDLREGEIHSSAVIEGVLHLGCGTRILPGVFIEGNVVIGENCKIGPNCYIRGNTSIGDQCHIGQSVEIKNCLILSRTNVGHLSYIGDSVIGEKVNLGAGTMTSNLRHDGKNHLSMVGDVLVDTGRRKFGTIIGDCVHTGIQTSIYPGRKLWPYTSTRPAEIVQKDLHS